MNIDLQVKKLIEEFSKLEDVRGILLAGSQATKTNDENSDYDIYIYTSKYIPIESRKIITDKYFKYIELNNKFWETEDDGILKEDNIPVEIIYRNLDWISTSLNRTIVECEADIGYTTCFWSNLMKSIILYDKCGELKKLQEKYNVYYPEKLRGNIIKKNYPLLKKQMPAYYYQIEKALKRNDFISINHRVAALLSSYFDIIFAINKMPHPGEKKIFQIIRENDLKAPNKMEMNVMNILKDSSSNDNKILKEIDSLIDNLDILLEEEGINIVGY